MDCIIFFWFIFSLKNIIVVSFMHYNINTKVNLPLAQVDNL
jgi:hypothetical protein